VSPGTFPTAMDKEGHYLKPPLCVGCDNDSSNSARANITSLKKPALKQSMVKEKEKSPTERLNKSLNKGLTSADRSNKATLPLTVPSSFQVVCK
jgi:hypothetical protein